MVAYRRRRLIDSMLRGNNMQRAGEEAGYSPQSAATQASMTLSRPDVQQTFRQILSAEGASDQFLARKTFSLLNAQETKFFQKDGVIITREKVDALETQRKTLDTVLKVAGHLKERSELDVRVGIMAVVADALNADSE